jgi:hypothetical protein
MGESSLDSAMKKKIAAHPSRLPAQIHDLNWSEIRAEAEDQLAGQHEAGEEDGAYPHPQHPAAYRTHTAHYLHWTVDNAWKVDKEWTIQQGMTIWTRTGKVEIAYKDFNLRWQGKT